MALPDMDVNVFDIAVWRSQTIGGVFNDN